MGSFLFIMNNLIQKFGSDKIWVNYSLEVVEARITKIPYSPITKRKASSTNPSDWTTYEDAIAVNKNIGLVFPPSQKIIGYDFDHCLNEQGDIIGDNKEMIIEFLIEAGSYCEISPSSTGLHVFLSLTEPLKLEANRHDNIEIYNQARYFTVTQNVYKEFDTVREITPEECNELMKILNYPWSKTIDKPVEEENKVELIGDDQILEKMFSAKNGDKVKRLYDGDISDYKNDDSSADMALCSHLAFWTGKNPIQMERIWLQSQLAQRGKTQKRADYRKRTIHNAIKNCSDAYNTEIQKVEDLKYEFLIKNKKNTLCLENVGKVLRINPFFAGRFRWDNFKTQVEMKVNDEWVQFEDKHIINIQRIISTLFVDFQTVKKDMVYDAVFLIAHENFMDSAIDYLKGLVWDGEARLDTWLCSVYGVEDNVYHRAVGSNWMKGLVKRIMFPGSKYDQVLVIEGEQGSKKSLSLYTLGFNGDWHIETTQSTENKDFFMQFSSKPIIEFAEGETLSRTEVKRMKAIITTQNDKFRAPYDRVSRDHPRRCVFAMTTNSSEYLKDETGNRRWLPVTLVFEEANIEWIKDNRDQMYAEAYHRVITKNETTWEYPKEETKAQQDARRVSDPNSELVADWYFNAISEDDRKTGVTVLMVHIGAFGNQFSKKMQKYEEMNIANILKDVLKLEKKVTSRNGIKCTRWYPQGFIESNYLQSEVKSVFQNSINYREMN